MAMTPTSTVTATSIAFRAYMIDLFQKVGARALFRFFTEVMPPGRDLTQTLVILEQLPVLREWVGSREFPEAVVSTLSATPKTWEKSFKEKRKIADSTAGDVLLQSLTRWAGNPERDFDKIVTEFMLSNPTGYDGVALFHASHPRGPGGTTQGNTSATALAGPQHRAVLAAGGALRDENGESFEIQYNVLMVGPALAALARALTGSTRLVAVNAAGAEATSSVVAAALAPVTDLQVFDGGEIVVVVNPRFVGDHAQKYLYLDTTKGALPVAFFPGETQVDERTDPRSDNVFYRDEYEWGVRHDGTLIAGAWQTAYLGAP